MYCPTCADEFRDGITHCPDCDVDLVPDFVAPPHPPKEPELYPYEPVELFWTSDSHFLLDAASLLSSASIPFSTDGVESLKLDASAGQSTPEPIAARLLVPAEFYEEARVTLDRADMDAAAIRVPRLEGPEPPECMNPEAAELTAEDWFLAILFFAFPDGLIVVLILLAALASSRGGG